MARSRHKIKTKQHAKSQSTKRLTRIQDNLQQMKREVRDAHRKIKAQRLVKHKDYSDSEDEPRLIPKPRGSAGKTPPKGYNLQDEMGLANNKRRFNSLSALVRSYAQKYLDTTKTIKYQKPKNLVTVVEKIKKEHPFFRRFANAWPVHALIGQYLKNHCAAETASRKADKADRHHSRHKHHDSDSNDTRSSPDEDAEGPSSGEDRESCNSGNYDRLRDKSDIGRKSRGGDHWQSKDKSDIGRKSCGGGASSNQSIDKSDTGRKSHGGSNQSRDKRKSTSGGSAHQIRVNQSQPSKKGGRQHLIKKQPVGADRNPVPKAYALTVKKPQAEGDGKQTSGSISIKPIKPPAKQDVSTTQPYSDTESSHPIRPTKKTRHTLRITSDSEIEANDTIGLEIDPRRAKQKNANDTIALTKIDPRRAEQKNAKQPFVFDEHVDIPKLCPDSDCVDVVPTFPSPVLVDMFRTLKKLQYDNAHENAIGRHMLFICGAISKEVATNRFRDYAQSRNWRVDIDFPQLPHRILSKKAELDKLMTDPLAKTQFCAWEHLTGEVEDAKMSLKSLGNCSITRVPGNIRNLENAGYYGPKGIMIIECVLLHMYPPEKTPTNAFLPLTLSQYTSFFLIPHVAACLIAEDMDTTYESGWVEMVPSGETGKRLHMADDNDPELDALLQSMRVFVKKALGGQKPKTNACTPKKLPEADKHTPLPGPSKFSGSLNDQNTEGTSRENQKQSERPQRLKRKPAC